MGFDTPAVCSSTTVKSQRWTSASCFELTPFGHNIQSNSARSSSSAKTDPSGTQDFQRLSCGVWHTDVGNGSLGSFGLGFRPSKHGTCPSTSRRLGSGEFGGPVYALAPLSCSSGHSWADSSGMARPTVLLGGHCHRGVTLPWGCGIHRNPRLPSRTSHCTGQSIEFTLVS